MAPFFYAHVLLQVYAQEHSEADSDAIMDKSAPAAQNISIINCEVLD